MEKPQNVDEYIAQQRAAIAANPECGNSHYNLAVGLLGQRKFDEAEKALLEAIEQPDPGRSLCSAGWDLPEPGGSGRLPGLQYQGHQNPGRLFGRICQYRLRKTAAGRD